MKVKSFQTVSSLEEAYKLLNESPKNKILAGGLWLKKGNFDVETLIDISKLGLDRIEDKGDFIEIGSMVTLREAEKSNLIPSMIKEALGSIMAPGFRNIATIGGSIYGKFGFSDVVTAFLGYEVTLVFYPEAELSLDEYVSKSGFHDGILTHVLVKKTHANAYFKKVGITALDYPILNIAVTKEDKYKIVIGSRPQVAFVCESANTYLNDGNNNFEEAAKIVVEETLFGDSLSAKTEYRKQLAKTYVVRALKEVSK